MPTAPSPSRKPKPAAKLPKLIEKYYAALQDLAHQHVLYEMGTRPAFHALLAEVGKQHGWTLIAEHEKKVGGKGVSPLSRSIRPDGTFKDHMNLVRGYWEAKDTADNLDAEIAKKRKAGYPTTNMIFEDTATAVLFQHGQEILRVDMHDPGRLAELLTEYFRYVEPEIEEFEQAVNEFKLRVPDLAAGLKTKIEQSHKSNRQFQAAFDAFYELCKTSLNPNLSVAAVDEMLIQHILTERLIREIFDNPEFVRRNVIAAEVEKVMLAMTSQSFDRTTYLRELDRFYVAIEQAARTMTDFADKQHFLNTVYERFFQGYSVKLADTMGIVYTPQEIVDFMCASVEEVLEKEFGKHLWSDDVYIIDPCTGTGNFIVNLIRRIPKAKLEDVYKHRLFANEIMLLPYYIAALNIEHAYFEQTGTYEPFEGLCFVDSLDLAEHAQRQLGFMTAANSQRVERQRRSPITVVIGNPPYNVGQANENDNNKNRRYQIIDDRISVTYAKQSRASSKSKLSDAYVKFFRWASDRLEDRDGIVAFVTNNGFVDQFAFDGMRYHLAADFTSVYHVDLHGNVRHNPKLSGTTHNVFGIQVGVGITIAIRNRHAASSGLSYHRVPESWRREEKLRWLARTSSLSGVNWRHLQSDDRNTWLVPEGASVFRCFLSTLADGRANAGLFERSSLGVVTARDSWVYDFSVQALGAKVKQLIDTYNCEIDRWNRRDASTTDPDAFVLYDDTRIKWSRDLKLDLQRKRYAKYSESKIRPAMYRPFTREFIFYDSVCNEEIRSFPRIFPPNSDVRNAAICVSGPGNQEFRYLISCAIVDYKFANPANGGTQCFPFYVYDEDGSNRRENITDWALKHFRDHYQDENIDKWAVFHYVYGLLHHPGYREKFADNLKRELPRIPLAPALDAAAAPDPNPPRKGGAMTPQAAHRPPTRVGGSDSPSPSQGEGRGEGSSEISDLKSSAPRASSGFWSFASAGKQLAALHLDYEKLDPWPLKVVEAKGEPLSYRVDDKMRLSKDKTALAVNKSLTLEGIPPEAFTYRLGNRSALEWVIDQYQVYTDPRSGITSDPNRPDDPQYIIRLVGQVIRVSLETMKIVAALPTQFAPLSRSSLSDPPVP